MDKNISLVRKNVFFKLISILLIALILFFQIIPSMSFVFEDVHNTPAQNSATIYPTKHFVYNISSLFAQREVRSIVWKAPYYALSIFILHILKEDLYYTYILSQYKPYDFRKVIKEAMTNHFNGSKYKVLLLAI